MGEGRIHHLKNVNNTVLRNKNYVDKSKSDCYGCYLASKSKLHHHLAIS